ncbi:proton-conducting transporter membrane subunit [Sorangium sp. So ce233]
MSAGAAVWVISLFPRARDGGVIRETISWVPSLGLDLVLRIDGFAWMFAVLITVIGALVCLYARYCMSPEDPVARLYALFLLARLWPALSGTELWFWIVSGAGMTTLLLGAYIAMFQNDLKRVLANSTISHLGLITLLRAQQLARC